MLSQNFRTHNTVLELSHSTIELLLHFFPHSVDMLKHESSLICGEAPVVLENGNRENSLITFFSNSKYVGGKNVGFGQSK